MRVLVHPLQAALDYVPMAPQGCAVATQFNRALPGSFEQLLHSLALRAVMVHPDPQVLLVRIDRFVAVSLSGNLVRVTQAQLAVAGNVESFGARSSPAANFHNSDVVLSRCKNCHVCLRKGH